MYRIAAAESVFVEAESFTSPTDGWRVVNPSHVPYGPQTWLRVTLTEGKNRQIRRMVRKVGHKVLRLHRIRVANIRLGNLKPGTWRHLAPEEVKRLTAPPSPQTPTPKKSIQAGPRPKARTSRKK